VPVSRCGSASVIIYHRQGQRTSLGMGIANPFGDGPQPRSKIALERFVRRIMSRPLRIVVADDEADLQAYYQKVLLRMGHEVVAVARDGAELVKQCRTVCPDLVLTDIYMPLLDGIEAAARICEQRPIPIILVSSYFDNVLIERAEASQVQAYLVKPIKQADLVPAIALAVRRFAQLRDLQAALGRVKLLQGLLPICMYCKKIRNDRNYWQQLETYIASHSEAHFSHGICPACFEHIVKPELAARARQGDSPEG
jgi:AmiR/NasT family two-component response regulator